MQSNYKRIGDYIKEVKQKNVNLEATLLLGININKFFMPSVANVIGTDMSNYRIVKKNQKTFLKKIEFTSVKVELMNISNAKREELLMKKEYMELFPEIVLEHF